MSLYNADITDAKSKAFLLGLYVGLSLLLLLVACLDSNQSSALHKATNVYGIQALAGAVLGFWRIRKSADNPKALPALSSIWISIGLASWAIAQGLWTWAAFRWGDEVPYPGVSDIFYLSSNLCWLVALLMIFKTLGRRSLPAISPFTKVLVPVGLSLLIAGLPTWVASRLDPASFTLWGIASDFVYILLTFSSVLLAVGLLLGENSKLPLPVHQCIRYLFAASLIDAIAILAFTVTVKLPAGYALGYYNGNWVDWLFLTAMYCWGVSALKCPVREEALDYSFHTTRSKVVGAEDIYRASDIAKDYSHDEPLINTKSISWILDTIPECWGVVKLGQLVVGSTFVLPVPCELMERLRQAQPKENQTKEQMFEEVEKTEREMFEEAKKSPLTWDCLYLADASILTRHRRRGLAFESFCNTIGSIKKEHRKSHIDVYYWSITPERRKLAEKLGKHFDEKVITVLKLD